MLCCYVLFPVWNTLKTSLTAVISSGPTPSPGIMVTLKMASARASGDSEPQRPWDKLSCRDANCCHREGPRPCGTAKYRAPFRPTDPLEQHLKFVNVPNTNRSDHSSTHKTEINYIWEFLLVFWISTYSLIYAFLINYGLFSHVDSGDMIKQIIYFWRSE